MTFSYSIVLPTWNRLDVLSEVLEALDGQAHAPTFEIIVVDDGSTDGTAAFLDGWAVGGDRIVLHQENRGPAAARNRGVERARGERVAFLGDDTVPSSGWLAAHDRAWRRQGSDPDLAFIGYTAWHPRMRLTPFLRHINEQGAQFGYALIDDPSDVPFNFFYTSNLTLDRTALLEEPFDLGFPYAAWEDIEVSYRLKKRGMRLMYEATATVAHDHPTDLTRFAERQERAGYSAIVFRQLHPELSDFLGVGPQGPPPLPSTVRQWIREVVARLLQKSRFETPLLWDDLLRFHYIRGLQRGWNDLVQGGDRP